MTPTDRKLDDVRLPGGCRLWRFQKFSDARGDLSVANLGADLPFPPKRVFFIYNVPGDGVRGEHAHRECIQLLVAVSGAVSILVDDLRERDEIVLDDPRIGLLVSPRTWVTMRNFSKDAVLVGFASHAYSPDEYIRDSSEFVRLVSGARDD
jgi:dTDP-4-dehydrorhamnose 3,5-epimerase-like enzyme